VSNTADATVLAAAVWESQRILRNGDAKKAQALVAELREILEAPEVVQALERSRTDREVDDE
jgi:hypothetical protein